MVRGEESGGGMSHDPRKCPKCTAATAMKQALDFAGLSRPEDILTAPKIRLELLLQSIETQGFEWFRDGEGKMAIRRIQNS